MSPLEMDIATIMGLVLLMIGIMFVVKYTFGKKPESGADQPGQDHASLDCNGEEFIERIRREATKHSMRTFGRRPGKISIK